VPEKETRRWGAAWAAAVAFVAVAAIVAGTLVYLFRSMGRLPGEAARGAREVAQELRRVAEAFRQGTITTSFTGYATSLTGSNFLQFARLQQTEIFERTDRRSLLWGQLPLPDVVVEARAPVEYTYYVDLDGRWDVRATEGLVRVTAPAPAFNAPALDPSALRFTVREGSVFRDEDVVTEGLKAALAELLRERARQHVPLVRDVGRRKVQEFVEKWLVERFSDGRAYRVEVAFADEAGPAPLPSG
jgi:hypothetical protein